MKLPNVTKVQLHEILVLYNVRMVPNVKKNKGNTECDKSTVTCDFFFFFYGHM